MPSRAGVRITRTTTRTRSRTSGTSGNSGGANNRRASGGGQRRCPVCGKYMSNRRSG